LKKVTILIAVPFDLYFASEIEVQCHNFRKFGYSSALHVIVYETGENTYREYWDRLAKRYKEVKFFFYSDDSIQHIVKAYPPYIRPFCFQKHWMAHPELEEHTIIYLDGDVIFSKHLDFSKYINDDICYMSKTKYIDANYFADKRKDVLPFRLADYDKVDVLENMAGIAGISKQTIIDNIENTGGCQYILKGITADFWAELGDMCIQISMYAKDINRRFFSSEDKGFQSWALGDMCGLLWLLWKRGKETRCPEELDFSWSSNPIEEYGKHAFFHNAGVIKNYMELHGEKRKLFNKNDLRFRSNTLTFFDLEYEGISEDYCSIMYVKAIKEVEDPICKTNKLLY